MMHMMNDATCKDSDYFGCKLYEAKYFIIPVLRFSDHKEKTTIYQLGLYFDIRILQLVPEIRQIVNLSLTKIVITRYILSQNVECSKFKIILYILLSSKGQCNMVKIIPL